MGASPQTPGIYRIVDKNMIIPGSWREKEKKWSYNHLSFLLCLKGERGERVPIPFLILRALTQGRAVRSPRISQGDSTRSLMLPVSD